MKTMMYDQEKKKLKKNIIVQNIYVKNISKKKNYIELQDENMIS